MGSPTRIDKALRLAQKEVFELENGARPGVAKILFLLTDGSQTQERGSENPVAIANELRSTGVTIIVIGITNAVNVSELSDIAGGEENAYAADSFEKLKDFNFLDVIKTKMCETANVTSFITSTTSVPTSTSSSSSTTSSTTAEPLSTQSLETAKVQPTCEAIVDIVFLLDSSGSLRKYYQNEKDFLKSVISAFGVSVNGTRAAVVTFSYHAQLSIKLNKYSNLKSFNEAVDNIVLMGSPTRIDKALRLAQKEVFELENGARPGVAKILFLLTDGSQTQERGSENPVAIANELRSTGVTIIVIGITNAVNVSELSDIAGGEENAYAADSFEKLKDFNFLDVIKTKMCETANVTSFITSTTSVPTSTSSSSSTTSSTTAEPLSTQSLETAKVQPTCEAIVDIVFLLDSSGSLRKYYQNEKDFLKSVISAFGVSVNGTRAAVVTFSYHAQLSIKLNKYSNLKSFNEAVDNIVLMGSTTRIDKALRLAQKEVFELENGARPGVAKILFLLTDGSQTQERGSENPVAIANELRSTGVTIIVIGITNAVNVSELSDIAGGEENAYAADSFEKLKDFNFLDVIKTKMCETANVTSFITSTTSVPTSTSSSSSTTSSTTAEPLSTQSLETAKVQPTCEAIVDIVFLLDSSGSLRKYYQNEKDFLKSVISAFGVSVNGTRAAVVTFSYHAQLSIKLNKYSNLKSFNEAVDNIVLMGSTTRIDKALRLAQKEVFELENGARPGVAKILFLLTDGSQTQERGSENPVAIANELRSTGVTIIVIGITNAVNVSELSDIAGGEENAYAADSFEKLKDFNFLDVIKTKMCETANVTSFITSTTSVPTSTSSSSSTTSSTTAEPLSTQSLETAKVQPTCEAIVDIVFLLDSSGSLRKYYQNEKDFLKSVISAFGVSVNGTRAAVVTFSYHAQLSIKLNKYSNLKSFNEAVDNIVLMGSTTRIDKALRLAQKEVFELENGARPGVAKILFLLTDGSQTQERGSENPVAIANELRSTGVTIIVIGITNAVNVSELSDIAGGEENAYAADSFEKLKDFNFLDVIKTKMCETANVTSFITSTTSVPTSTSSSSSTTSSTTAEPLSTQSLETAKVQPTCEAIVDIVFLLDSSGSLRKYYQNEKDFLKSVISAFGVSVNGTRAAVVTFSYHAQLSIKLNKYSNLKSFNEAVDNIVLMGSTTRIDKALRLAQKEVFELENGARPGVAKILFLLTDGSQTQERGSENPVAIANELRSTGVTIIVIGITNAVNVSELSDIAGGEENAYAADSFEKLKDFNFLDVIKTKMCETANVTSFITSTTSVPTSTSSSSSTTSSTTAEPLSTQSLETAKVQPTCEAIVDIVFLLDSSGSLRKYYQNEKDFLKSVISAFGVSVNGTRAAVVTFSYHAQLSIKLNKYSNLKSFNEAVDNIVLMGSTTRIDKALRLAQKEVFELENGARPGVAKILFLLTDGSQTQERGSENPVAIANELRSTGVTIIVIGITNAVNVSELSDIAGGEENAYAADSFEKLKDFNFLDVIKTKMCETANVTSFITSTTSVPTSTSSSSSTTSSTTAEPLSTQSLETAKVQPTCEAIVDIVFLLDSSGSLRKYYQNEKDFLKSVISAFGVSVNGTRAAVVTFSYHAQLSIKLNKYSNLKSFNEAVDNIVLMGSTTRIDKALRLAQKEVFELENGARPGVAKILFLLTDGSQTQERGSENPVAIANELRSTGVTIIVIGITNAVNVSELSDIAGGEENAYAADSFEKLKDFNFLDVIKTKMCETANVTSFITSTTSVPTSTSSSSSTTSSTTAEPLSTQSLETAKVQPTCEAIVDIVFLLDSSGSLRKYYQNEKDFLKSVISAFGVSVNGTRAAVVTFSYHAQLSIKLNKYSNLKSFNEAVDNIVLMGSTTRIDKALRLAQKEVFELENGARPGVAKILFLLTDGSQTQERGSENPVAIANELRSTGVTIIVIGITNAVNVSELSDIAGGEENAYAADSFEKLKDFNFLDVIKTKMCETVNLTL
ncbi:collagen alpha-3(VI) chain-like [Hydra vulgaris]|uniref:Collagen alpha-3(VI) chain-like n=1 Tax=Hydra vulgaris TaxID=6087 RepID=A0ABM4BVW5_HYDVU